MRALVLDGDTRAALSIVRCLGRHGIDVIVASEDEASLAGCSRWCSKRLVYPCPRSSSGAFEDWLVSTLAQMPDCALFTASDVTTSLVGRCKAQIPDVARSMLPPRESLEVALDKAATLELALRLGVPGPKSRVYRLGQKIDPDLDYPVAVKAAKSDLPYRAATAFARDDDELNQAVANVLSEGSSAMVQEVVTGEGMAVFALFDSGESVVAFAHRRLIEKPPWGGVSVLCESVEPRADALEFALRILKELKWHGVAMAEFKLSADGTPCLMEINPRYWGSLELAVRSGVEFPYLAYQMAAGCAPAIPRARRAVDRWVLGEIDSLTTSVLRKASGRSRMRDIMSHVWSLRYGLCCEVERIGDIRPALYEHSMWFRTSLDRVAARTKGGRPCANASGE